MGVDFFLEKYPQCVYISAKIHPSLLEINPLYVPVFEKRLKTHHPFKEKRRLWSLKVGRMDVDGKFELLMFSLTLK